MRIFEYFLSFLLIVISLIHVFINKESYKIAFSDGYQASVDYDKSQ